MSSPLRALAAASLCGILLAAASPARAQDTWLRAGDGWLRSDLQLLVDEGVLSLGTTTWPIPTDDVLAALRRVDPLEFHSAALRAAFDRVAVRLGPREDEAPALREVAVRAGRPALLRDYETIGREEGEATLRGGFRHGRWSANVAGTVVASPADGQALRFDGTDFSVRLGNWNFSANALERWWGPGHFGSLILSTNARPLPQLALDRVVSSPSSVPILHWAGPWRFSAFVGFMERERVDVDAALFMGMRLTFKPLQIVEIGLSRSAQFCGRGRPCDVETFGRVLLGRDNAGIRVAPEDEPGNQMAGFDLRLVSPARSLPVALYAQMIGEDSSTSAIPAKYLGQFGVEGWWLFDHGSLRVNVEYANTSCTFQRPRAYPDCAYRQGIFFAGYRYRGAAIGHTTDADSESISAGVRWQVAGGAAWRLSYVDARLDRFGAPDPYHSVVFGAANYRSATVGWDGTVLGQALRVQLDVGRLEPRAGTGTVTRVGGFVGWSHRF